MKKYEVLENIADLKLKIFGQTKEELFRNALSAMLENQGPEMINSDKIQREIKIKSLDLFSLLVDFLNEALYLSQTNKETYFDIKFKKFTEAEGEEDKSSSSPFAAAWEIEAELFGQKVARFGEDIKAATHHSLEIQQKKEKRWEAIILFDT